MSHTPMQTLTYSCTHILKSPTCGRKHLVSAVTQVAECDTGHLALFKYPSMDEMTGIMLVCVFVSSRPVEALY